MGGAKRYPSLLFPRRQKWWVFAALYPPYGTDIAASPRKPRRLFFQRQPQAVAEIRHRAVRHAQHDDLQNLVVIIVLRRRAKLRIAQRRAMMERIDGREQPLLCFRPER